MPKHAQQLRIDVAQFDPNAPASGVASDVTDSPAPPAMGTVDAPSGLTLSTLLSRSSASPTALVNATWTPPDGYDTSTLGATLSYLIQWSTDPTFVANAAGAQALQPSASIDGLTTGTLYYFRVAAVYRTVQSPYSAVASITTALDTVPPGPPIGGSAVFAGIGDLVLVWGNPTSSNFKDVEIKIYASSGGALLATLYSATEHLIWTAAENVAATAGAGDPSLFIELRSRSWQNIYSTIGMTGPVTKAAPTAPTVTVDFTGKDAVFTITPPADSAYLSFVADTGVTARRLAVIGRYVYPFDQNRFDHGAADPVLAYSFTAVDGLNQASTATTGTATNAAPAAPTITLIGGFSQLVCQVTSAMAPDFLAYEYVWKRDGSIVLTLESASAEQQYATGAAGDEGSHSWTCTVRQKDVFAQFSTATVSSTVVLDTLTIAYLRSGLIFSDSVGNTVAALSVLKDDNKVSSGISYAA